MRRSSIQVFFRLKWIEDSQKEFDFFQNSIFQPTRSFSTLRKATITTRLYKKICDENTKPKNCPQFDGMFNYMKGWSGESGSVGTDYCAYGTSFVSGTEKRYYAMHTVSTKNNLSCRCFLIFNIDY